MTETAKTYHAPIALLPNGWRQKVRISVSADGTITAIEEGVSRTSEIALRGPVLPGMPNLHSHAFQRAMAGLAEVAQNPADSFWTWRDLMYRLVGRLTPEQIEAIATYLYIEMLKAGYTSVAEFHYLHHDPAGRRYGDPAELSKRIVAAARNAGIGLTLLPTFYAHGGFGGRPPSELQRRFINDVDSYLRILSDVQSFIDSAGQTLGLCFHSLRAATREEMLALLAADPQGKMVVHIHIAEQTKEVEDCLQWSGMRPIEWLYRHFEPDQRWCLVHATHADHSEIENMARSGAIVGLCPTTEANLGDGIFPAISFVGKNGRFGIGSDSHVSVSVVEELRWLEYGQRLRDRRRNRMAAPPQTDVAIFLFQECARSGAIALGQSLGALEIGKRADLVVLDGDEPMLSGIPEHNTLGRWIFGGQNSWIRDVAVKGKWVIQDRHHREEESVNKGFIKAMTALKTLE